MHMTHDNLRAGKHVDIAGVVTKRDMEITKSEAAKLKSVMIDALAHIQRYRDRREDDLSLTRFARNSENAKIIEDHIAELDETIAHLRIVANG